MSEKTWTDQPDEVERAEVLLTFHANGRTIEVRRQDEVPDPAYYVSTGGLFGSQTVKCPFEDTLWAVLREAQKAPGEACLPKDAILMPDPEAKEEV